jgi:hypothetical protein
MTLLTQTLFYTLGTQHQHDHPLSSHASQATGAQDDNTRTSIQHGEQNSVKDEENEEAGLAKAERECATWRKRIDDKKKETKKKNNAAKN